MVFPGFTCVNLTGSNSTCDTVGLSTMGKWVKSVMILSNWRKEQNVEQCLIQARRKFRCLIIDYQCG